MSDEDNYISRFKLIEDARKQVPVDLGRLANDLGIDVEVVPLDKQISGEIKIRADKSLPALIRVNSNHSHSRQRFTCAHEIGHYVLHNFMIGDGVTDNVAYRASSDLTNSSKITQLEETEANKFAAYLLMPEEAIIELANEGKNRDEIADFLKVSRQALNIKMNSMDSSLAKENTTA